MRTPRLVAPAALGVLALSLSLGTSCVVGSPPGFGGGDVWTIPLVGPLDDDVLLVPVSIGEAGPYLFLIDPDSNTSSIDGALVSELELYSGYGPEETTEADTRVPTFYVEVPNMKAGNLSVRQRKWRVHKVGTYTVGGRLVRGVLGRDIIADSLIFAIDRDAGIVQIAEQGKLSPGSAASKIGFRNHFGRKIATVTVNGQAKMSMHLDLGGRLSRLWEEKIAAAKLPRVGVSASLVDEYGTVQHISSGAIAAEIEAGGEAVQGLLVVPYGDKRMDPHDIDGSLGEDFFSRFKVVANWHKKSVWITRRDGDLHGSAKARMNRWSAVFAGCATPGCVSVTLADGGTAPGGASFGHTATRDPSLFADPIEPADPADPADPVDPADPAEAQPAPTDPNAPLDPPSGAAPIPPPQQAPRFRVERATDSPELAAAQRIEVLLDAVNAKGVPLGLPKVQVTLRAGVDLVEGQLDSTYAGADRLEIIDVSPLGRNCEAGEKCYWVQTKTF